MTCAQAIFRVAGDLGPPIEVTHNGVNVNGWTITARFKKETGELYESTATITVDGDPNNDIPAEYNFQFAPGDLTEGDHEWEINYSDASIDDFTLPAQGHLAMTVRESFES